MQSHNNLALGQTPGEDTEKRCNPLCHKDDFKKKYLQFGILGEGGFGSVYAGYRKSDLLPVAIKYIRGDNVLNEIQTYEFPLEVALMRRAAGGPESVGKSAAVTLLDWYYIDPDLILVMERPVLSDDLSEYLQSRGDYLKEDEAKLIMSQLVDAAIDMYHKGVFHQDIKCSNILMDKGSGVLRVRVIDFGCGSFLQTEPYHHLSGTLEYTPPEWFTQRKYRGGPTTVWQLGAVLFQMLHGCSFNTILFMKGRIGLSRKLSRDCRNFLQHSLAKDPEERATLPQLKNHPWLKKSL